MAHKIGVLFYVLNVVLGIGLLFNFVVSLLRGDLSPWWFWPAGVGVIVVLQMIAGNLVGKGQGGPGI